MQFLHREYSWHQSHFLLCSINCIMLPTSWLANSILHTRCLICTMARLIVQQISGKLTISFNILHVKNLTYIITCNKQSHAIWSSAVTLGRYLRFWRKLRKQSQRNMHLKHFLKKEAEMHQNRCVVCAKPLVVSKAMLEEIDLRTHLEYQHSLFFSPEEHLAVSFPRRTEWCVQPSITNSSLNAAQPHLLS